MHPQTLRSYERLGLVRPQRSSRQSRLYSQRDVERLQRIQRLTRDLGVNLAGVEVILDLLDRMEALREEMQQEIHRLSRRVEELQGAPGRQ
jgi:MerR family transcriptional regulator/heat shock protein HspR